MLKIGIVGLPNAGKSTLFNALAARRLAKTAPHPFTTIDPQTAVVAVPDERLEKLAALIKPEKTTPATVTFLDIAGLVKNAHKGEGLGNQFLAKIREMDAIVHVVRVHRMTDPTNDIRVIEDELKQAGVSKPMVLMLNHDEGQEDLDDIKAKMGNHPVIPLCAKLEEDMADLDPAERREYRQQLHLGKSGLAQLIQKAYALLGRMTFYTIKGGRQVRATSVQRGTSAIDAAGKVHTDFASRFIKAHVISVEKLISAGSWKIARARGYVRTEGRDYVVCDGDVLEFMVH